MADDAVVTPPGNGESFEIVRGTTTLSLTTLLQYRVVSFDGFGMPPVKNITQRGPLQDGSTVVGFRLEPRFVQVVVYAYSGTWAGYHTDRKQLIGMLRPSLTPIIFRWTYNGIVRCLDCYFSQSLKLPSTDIKGGRDASVHGTTAAFELLAPDPTWYDPSLSQDSIVASASGSGFVFPLTTPFMFGTTSFNNTINIQLNDTNAYDTYPKIVIGGPVTNLKITNNTLGTVLDFTGKTLGSGAFWIIETRYGTKTITDAAGVNKIDQLTQTGSNLATWRLAPGDNSITVTGTSVDNNTGVYWQYNKRFLGE